MFDRDKWQEIFETIQKNKWRTLATAFGVFWGILMLVLLLGAGQGLQNGVVSNMILDSTNSIWFFTDRTSLPYKGLPPGRILEFTEEDLGYIKKNVPGIEYISPENGAFGNYTITYGKKASSYQVLGTGEDYFNIKIYQQYVAGRKLNLNDNIESRKVCVIGDRVAEVLFATGRRPYREGGFHQGDGI
jgi:putative ABC transport system permease protein